METLARTKARIFLAHGSADRNVTVAHFDMMYAGLLSRGKDVTARRVEGADHGYRIADPPQSNAGETPAGGHTAKVPGAPDSRSEVTPMNNAGETPALPQRDGWKEMFEAVRDWFSEE
jgi:hypothetical protein